MPRRFLVACGILALLATALGAFGAHALQGRVPPEALRTFETAVRYHFYHALGLGIVAMSAGLHGLNGWLRWSARVMLAGVCLFSGSLYGLVLTGEQWLGAITPVGGTALMVGWGLLVVGLLKGRS